MATNGTLQFDDKHEKDLQRIREFCLLDDDFLAKVFEDKECAELLLRIILNKKDLTVTEVHSQYDLKNLQGRSARLDIFAVDANRRVHNIEVQRDNRGAVWKRARYNSSLIDANITEPGDEYEMLPESYVIFITENDVMKAGFPLYHINRYTEETGNIFNDESHIIYVNAQIKDQSALGKLMHDFSCTNPADMNYSILAERVRYFKENKEGIKVMSKIVEDIRLEASRQVAVRLLIRGKDTLAEIAEITNLPLEEVELLDTNKQAKNLAN